MPIDRKVLIGVNVASAIIISLTFALRFGGAKPDVINAIVAVALAISIQTVITCLSFAVYFLFKKNANKRKVLIIVNVASAIITFLAYILFFVYSADSPLVGLYSIYTYISAQAIFTCLTLIVYYLSIMAGALDKKYKEEMKNSEENE